ncbi:MAG: hypothetical protein ACYC92_14935, partial [Candidatus Acidiferrales bacterium]
MGVGLELKGTAGASEFRAGISAKANVEVPSNSLLSLSRSTEIGVAAGPTNGPKIGENISVEKPLVTVNLNRTVTGPQAPKVEVTDTLGGTSTINSLLKKCSWPPFLPLRGNRSLQKPKENADSSSRLLVGMTTNR